MKWKIAGVAVGIMPLILSFILASPVTGLSGTCYGSGYQCEGDILYKCINNQWTGWQSCAYGCCIDACCSAPTTTTSPTTTTTIYDDCTTCNTQSDYNRIYDLYNQGICDYWEHVVPCVERLSTTTTTTVPPGCGNLKQSCCDGIPKCYFPLSCEKDLNPFDPTLRNICVECQSGQVRCEDENVEMRCHDGEWAGTSCVYGCDPAIGCKDAPCLCDSTDSCDWNCWCDPDCSDEVCIFGYCVSKLILIGIVILIAAIAILIAIFSTGEK